MARVDHTCSMQGCARFCWYDASNPESKAGMERVGWLFMPGGWAVCPTHVANIRLMKELLDVL